MNIQKLLGGSPRYWENKMINAGWTKVQSAENDTKYNQDIYSVNSGNTLVALGVEETLRIIKENE